MATKTRDALIKEARLFQANKQASSSVTTSDQAVPEDDPNEKGKVTVPAHPDGDSKEKTEMPNAADSRPHNDTEVPDGVTESSKTNPGPTGTDRKPTLDGDARDAAFTSPTTPLDKIASDTKAILGRLQAFSSAQKSASTQKPAETQAPAAQAPIDGAEAAFRMKLANAILSTERGVQIVEDYLAEYEGAKQAAELVQKAASERNQFLQESAAMGSLLAAAEQQFIGEIDNLGEVIKSASQPEIDRWVKLANEHLKNLGQLDPAFHQYYKAAAADAAMVVEAMMMGEEPGIPGGEGDLAPEQLEGLIAQLVEAGQLDPAMAEQLLAALVGGEGGAPEGAEGGLPPEAAKAASLAARLMAEVAS